MSLQTRLDRIEKENVIGNDWIAEELPAEVKQILMEHYLLMHGTDGALEHARSLLGCRDRRPRTIPPMPIDVREDLRKHCEDIDCEHAALPRGSDRNEQSDPMRQTQQSAS
ncbi:MAG: hypothetical protein ACR2RA_09805 [Geminicoccaceae bacterium]